MDNLTEKAGRTRRAQATLRIMVFTSLPVNKTPLKPSIYKPHGSTRRRSRKSNGIRPHSRRALTEKGRKPRRKNNGQLSPNKIMAHQHICEEKQLNKSSMQLCLNTILYIMRVSSSSIKTKTLHAQYMVKTKPNYSKGLPLVKF